MDDVDGVQFTHLDEPLFEGAGASKRDLVEYLDAVHEAMLPGLRDRPLSVVRAHRGDAPFMQKNLPRYAPGWISRVGSWSESSHREVIYALCNDRRTLLWFANQRAVEYHPALVRATDPQHMTHLVIDLDPPDAQSFPMVRRVAALVHEVLDSVGLAGALKTTGSKGLHIFVPISPSTPMHDAAAATRAIAQRVEALDPDVATTEFVKAARGRRVFVDSTRAGGGATVVAVFSPRVRPGVTVSFPLRWEELDEAEPADFTMASAPGLLERNGNPWLEQMPPPQALPDELVEHGHTIPIPRVAAMHEGLRRARTRRDS